MCTVSFAIAARKALNNPISKNLEIKIAFIKCNKNDKIFNIYMNISILLFIIGILGFVLNRKNIILMIIAIEIMLLSVTLLVLIMSYNFDDNIGQIFSIYILSIAGAESVIGLSFFFVFNDTATTEIYTLSLHDALPI